MKAWMLVSSEAYQKLNERGRLVCDRQELTMATDGGQCIRDAYSFMVQSMIESGLEKPDDAAFPFWCYTVIDGQRGAKPDDARLSSDGGYLLLIELNPTDMLESNLAIWDAVILGINLLDTGMEGSAATLLSGKEKGWDSIFDLNPRIKDINDGLDDERPTYQAVFWELKLDAVISTEQIDPIDLSEYLKSISKE